MSDHLSVRGPLHLLLLATLPVSTAHLFDPSKLPPTMADVVDSILDLMRRLLPPDIVQNVAALTALSPDHAADLLGSVDRGKSD
jgi:hypothetical protein